MERRSLASFILVVSLVACAGDDSRSSSASASVTAASGIASVSVSGSASAGSASVGSSGTTDADTDAGSGSGTSGAATGDSGVSDSATTDKPPPKFDLGVSPDGGMLPEDTGCKNVDLLFVIDNSGSMADEQKNLVASFPGFVQAMQTQLETAMSYHVGVTTSDSNLYNECAQAGALVTRTGGANSSNQTCGPYASGKAFMDETDALAQKFACAGQVGTGGDGNEQPMFTMNVALSPAMNAPGACNDGFIRDDALLVVVVITDEEDDHEVNACNQLPQSGSPGEPADWYNQLVARKGGIETNVVFLALVGPPAPNSCPPLDKCQGGIVGAEVAARITQVAEMFTYGSVGQVCAPNYDGFFSAAIGVIDSACKNFQPPG